MSPRNRRDSRNSSRNSSRNLAALILLASSSLGAAPLWRAGPSAPDALVDRYGAGMAYDPERGRVVLFGGAGAGQVWNDTWEFDGSTWVPGAPAPQSLVPRSGTAMVFDSRAGVSVLFGGRDAGYQRLDDTWTYDGQGWSEGPAAPVGLVARRDHGMAYDSRRQVTVLFGGDDGGLRNDTWELGAGGWSPGAPAPADLRPRSSFGIAYQEARGVVVIFGGSQGSSNVHLDDTWEYDGTAWREQPLAPIGDRWGQVMTYDSERGSIVMFGGVDCPTCVFSDTWEYAPDGGWRRGAEGATPRYHHCMAFDEARDRVVMIGGRFGPDATTWEYTPQASFLSGQGLAYPNRNKVRVSDPAGAPGVAFLAYGAGQWGVNVASGFVADSPRGAIVTAPGPGAVYGPHVRAFDADGAQLPGASFYAYGTLKYGANVGIADVLPWPSPPIDEILTGAGPGSVFGPHVRGFGYDGNSIIPVNTLSFFAYGTPRYGVNVAGASAAGSPWLQGWRNTFVTGPGPGPSFGPDVRIFGHWNGQLYADASFDALGTPGYGAVVAAGFSGEGSGLAELAAAPGPGPALSSRFRGFGWDGASVTARPGFDEVAFTTSYGGRVALGDIDSDLRTDLIAGAGPDPSADAEVRTYTYDGAALTLQANVFTAFTSLHGVNVSYGDLAP